MVILIGMALLFLMFWALVKLDNHLYPYSVDESNPWGHDEGGEG